MDTTEIRVFAMFPRDPANPEPFSNWIWVNCLTFPVDTLNRLRFTPKYYKWIRYATGVVIGAQGDLSLTQDLPRNVFEYNNGRLPTASVDLYYHTSDDEKQRMFPVDPNMECSNENSIDTTPRRASFRRDVVDRDRTCPFTGLGPFDCEAAHLLPHSKGDEYIQTYTQRRSRDPTGGDLVSNIDDVRNGLLLNLNAHNNLGRNIAFLPTPNFAMNTSDVDPTTPPTEKRCLAHLFTPDEPGKFGNSNLRSGFPIQMHATDKWPPSIIFDAVYAYTVLYHFSPQEMLDTLEQWKSIFYPREIMPAGQASHQAILDRRIQECEMKDQHDQEREDRAAARRVHREGLADDHPDFYDCLLILPYLMVPPDQREAVWKRAAEKRAERERSHLEDKVVGWAREVANASP